MRKKEKELIGRTGKKENVREGAEIRDSMLVEMKRGRERERGKERESEREG